MLIVCLAAAAAAGVVILIVLLNRRTDEAKRLMTNHHVQLTLRSNREAAGLEYVYLSFSNRTARPMNFIGDQKLQPLASVIEDRFDPSVNRVRRTNHTLARLRQMRAATLPAHSSVDFMVCYPSRLTNGTLIVKYSPEKGPNAQTVENPRRQDVVASRQGSQFDSIEIKLPLRPR